MLPVIKLDAKDRRILIELESDARQSNRSIAKKVGVNPDLIRRRIHRMEKEGVIGWFLTFVNFAKLGFTDYGVYITTQKLTKKRDEGFKDYLINHDKVSYVARLGGKYDFVIGILARDILEFHQILFEIFENWGEYISSRDIAIRVQLFHFSKSYLLKKQESPRKLPSFGGNVNVEELDSLDTRILSELATHARMNVVDLAKKIKSPLSTLALRVKKLKERGIIEGFFTSIRCQSYGYQNYLILATCRTFTKQQEHTLYTFCKQHQHITYLIKTVGKWDYEISVEVPDQERFQEVLTELREQFLETLANAESLLLFRELKYTLYPF